MLSVGLNISAEKKDYKELNCNDGDTDFPLSLSLFFLFTKLPNFFIV